MGNTDQMLIQPAALEEFAGTSSSPPALWSAVREVAVATRQKLSEERLAWISNLPLVLYAELFALVHASPQSCWRSPAQNASDLELASAYGSLERSTVVFGHVHRPSIRTLVGRPETLVNAGSVGLSYDGDPRASYVILDDGIPLVQRVFYDIERELRALAVCGLPGAEWTSKMLRTSSLQMP